mmetsp:Transcript_4983/g.15651  ORF Transcript_4983/g.15651 Transcript_4983/m.15651 type:complete len:338 (-) Transcript_4983:5845-6858(-)
MHQQKDQQDTAHQQDCLIPQDSNIRELRCMVPCPKTRRCSNSQLDTTSLLHSMQCPWGRTDPKRQCTLEVDYFPPHKRSQRGIDCLRRLRWTTGNRTPPALFRNRSPYQKIHHCRKIQPGKPCQWPLSCLHRNRTLALQYKGQDLLHHLGNSCRLCIADPLQRRFLADSICPQEPGILPCHSSLHCKNIPTGTEHQQGTLIQMDSTCQVLQYTVVYQLGHLHSRNPPGKQLYLMFHQDNNCQGVPTLHNSACPRSLLGTNILGDMTCQKERNFHRYSSSQLGRHTATYPQCRQGSSSRRRKSNQNSLWNLADNTCRPTHCKVLCPQSHQDKRIQGGK